MSNLKLKIGNNIFIASGSYFLLFAFLKKLFIYVFLFPLPRLQVPSHHRIFLLLL